MFFEAKDGSSYPVNRIVRILPDDGNGVRIELTGGISVDVFPYRAERIMKQPVSTFAAQPETFIVEMSEDTD